MATQKPTLSEHGKQTVRNNVVSCERSVAKARQWLEDAEENLKQARRVLICDHELKAVGGVTGASETTCTKCGFSWFD
jgi:hypothetical protein